MSWTAYQSDYRTTGYFSDLILDYIDNQESLRPFFSYEPTLEGIRKAIDKRKSVKVDRHLLVQQLQLQYQNLTPAKEVELSVQKLLNENTFTITTAHQPNLLTGPLYFIYKIIHVIQLAEYCNIAIPDFHFVPVYYMGMEDADFEELSHFTVKGKKYQWETKQQGAFGKMRVDQSLIQLLDALHGQLGNLPHADEMMRQLRLCFALDKTIAQATFEWVHHLFGNYGLVVLIPDTASLKFLLKDEMKDDLLHHTPQTILEKIKSSFPYPADWQANARSVNLFYMKDQMRERIEFENRVYKVLNTNIGFTEAELLQQLHEHPECFSPNVILRPLYQEKILPNLAYIGGSGELAYWLQLKAVFDHYRIPFPVLFLRNSYLLIHQRQHDQFIKLGFELKSFFKSADDLIKEYVKKHTKLDLNLDKEKEQLQYLFKSIQDHAGAVDITLKQHVAALHRNISKKLDALEKKMLRAEKRKYEEAGRQINQLKDQLFPDRILQERKESMLGYYAAMGADWIRQICDNTQTPEQQFTMLVYPSSY